MKQPSKRQPRYRNFVFTHNNYENTHFEDVIDCKYIAYSHEVGDSGTPHLQGYVCFNDAKTFSSVITLLPGCHIENMKGSIDQNGAYVSKSGAAVIERGVKPMSNDDKGRAGQLYWQNVLEKAKSGRIHEIDAKVQIAFYATLYRIAARNKPPPDNLEGPCGIWIYGPAGTGKTRMVMDSYPDCYMKPRKPWWDGYDGQEVAFMDEFHGGLVKDFGHEIKIWADFNRFTACIKGRMELIRPKKFIICSNYSIEELFIEPMLYSAIKRRFKVFYKTSIEEKYIF